MNRMYLILDACGKSYVYQDEEEAREDYRVMIEEDLASSQGDVTTMNEEELAEVVKTRFYEIDMDKYERTPLVPIVEKTTKEESVEKEALAFRDYLAEMGRMAGADVVESFVAGAQKYMHAGRLRGYKMWLSKSSILNLNQEIEEMSWEEAGKFLGAIGLTLVTDVHGDTWVYDEEVSDSDPLYLLYSEDFFMEDVFHSVPKLSRWEG